MSKNHSLCALCILAVSLTANAFVVDWDKITHWAGKGDARSALVVQFDDGLAEKAYIWGYRWDSTDGQPSGEDMFRAIATECNDLYLFTQYTGRMGNTVCGIGVSPDNAVANYIAYDFDSAQEDPNISFNWFSANGLLGQTSFPGWNTPEICAGSIEKAKETNILEHPIDAKTYGYACYDYDHWFMEKTDNARRWQAGWYQGYWSYWVGGTDSGSLSYSGIGYSSRKLDDRAVDAWKYTPLTAPIGGDTPDGYSGASTPWHELDYIHFTPNGIAPHDVDDTVKQRVIYSLDGIRIPEGVLPKPGFYILIDGTTSRKIIIH